ncbi:MAG TPA: hypothetical protein VJ692_00615 [Nitrospiraceae bacterium]|nr:hypothetical protein [Nitrospiraceae bacterium]
MWRIQLNAVLASVVVTLGFWLMWGQFPIVFTVILSLVVAGFLIWQCRTVVAVWAWATLVLGLESLAWPIITMVQVRMAGGEPTEEQMGLILTAMLFGLFSAIFWMTFAYGIFKWMRKKSEEEAALVKSASLAKKRGTRNG